MIRALTIALFLSGTLFLPWWAFLVLGIVLVAYTRDYLVAVLGAVFIDTFYGTTTIFGISFFYTVLFLILIFLSVVLRNRLLE